MDETFEVAMKIHTHTLTEPYWFRRTAAPIKTKQKKTFKTYDREKWIWESEKLEISNSVETLEKLLQQCCSFTWCF